MTFDLDAEMIHFQRLLGPLELGVLITDTALEPPGPTILYANRAIMDLTGYSGDELVGATPRILQGRRTERAVLDRLKEDLKCEHRFHGETYNYRKDGSEYIVEWMISPILSKSGAIKAWLAVLRDVTKRRLAVAAWAESERRFRQFGEASSNALWIRSSNNLRLEYVSSAFAKIFGTSPATGIGGDFEHWLDLVLPDDRERVRAQFQRIERGEQIKIEYRIRLPAGGGERWIHSTAFPLLDESGHVQRLGGIARDITQARKNSARLRELVAELQHRTRNLIAVVRSMAEKTMSSATSLHDFSVAFRQRLAALARVQGLLSRLGEHDRVTFDELIRAELLAHGAIEGEADSVMLSGPAGVRLRSSTVQTLAMALHELATNAVKYGALKPGGGRLEVSWEMVEGASENPQLRIDWRESGVSVSPESVEPAGTGQGRELIERALPYQMGASTSFELGPSGVHCSITVPLSKQRILEGTGTD